MVYPRRGGFVITAKQDLYIPSREAEADGSGAEEKRCVRERKGLGQKEAGAGARTNETGEKGTEQPK